MTARLVLVASWIAVAGMGCPTSTDPVDDDDTTGVQDDDDIAPDLDGDGFTEADGDCDDWDPDVHPDATEECDGIDNDCDGSIDEGFDDYDGDGIADCVDEDCAAEEPIAERVGILDSCPWSGTAAADPWDIVLEWRWFEPDWPGSYVTPAVANLSDDNGDGLIDDRDSPDVVLNLGASVGPDSHAIIGLRGDGTGILFEIDGNYDMSGVAVADVDLDGLPEVVTVRKIQPMVGVRVVAFDNEGHMKWESEWFDFVWETYGGL